MRSRTRDLLSAAAFLAAAAAMTWESFSDAYQEAGASVAHDPVFYPRILLAAIAVLATILLACAWRRRAEPGQAAVVRWQHAAVMIVAATVYVAAMPLIGFLVSTALFLAATPVLLGFRRWRLVVVVAVLVPIVSWLVFARLIQIPLPAATIPGLG